MQKKSWLIVFVLLVGCVGGVWGQAPQAGFVISNIPGRPAVKAGPNTIKTCLTTELKLTNTSADNSGVITNVCYFERRGVQTPIGCAPYSNGAFQPVFFTFRNTGADTIVQVVKDNNSDTDILIQPFFISDTHPDSAFSFKTPTDSCGLSDFIFTARNKDKDPNLIFQWTFDNSSPIQNTGNPVVNHFNKAIGSATQNYNASLLVIDEFGCTSDSIKPVKLKQIPDVNISSPNSTTSTVPPYNSSNFFTFCTTNTGASEILFLNNSTTNNSNYDLVWSKKSVRDSSFLNWSINDTISHNYYPGFDSITATEIGKNGCANSKQYGIFVGTNEPIGFPVPRIISICEGDSIQFTINSFEKNTVGTKYEITIDEVPLFDTVFYQADLLMKGRDTLTHVFNQSSCGKNGTNSFTASIHATNPCTNNLLAANLITGILVSGKPKAKMDISPSANICDNQTVTFTDRSDYTQLLQYCTDPSKIKGERVWVILSKPAAGNITLNASSSYGSFGPPWQTGSQTLIATFNGIGLYKIRMYAKNANPDIFSCPGTTDSSFYVDTTICVRNPPIAKFTLDKKASCSPDTLTASWVPDLNIACDGDILSWVVTPVNTNNTNCPTSTNSVKIDTGSTAQKAKIVFPEAGKYAISLKVTSKGGGCFDTYIDTVIINGAPLVTGWISKLPNICVSDSIQPRTTVDSCFSLGPLAYKWDFRHGRPNVYTGLTPPFIVYSTPSATPPGFDTITFSASNGCGAVNDTAYLTVNSLLQINPTKDTTICSGNPINITPSSPDGITGYFWTSKPIPAGSVTGNSSVTVTPGGTSITDFLTNTTNPLSSAKVQYYIQSAGGGCKSNVDTVTVTVLPTDTAYAGPDQYLCKGTDSCYLNATPPKFKQATGTWKPFGNNAAILDSHNPNTKVTGLAPNKTYTFLWTITGSGSPCVDSTDTVKIITDTIVNFIDQPTSICANDSVTIKGHVPAAPDSASYTYQWLQSKDNISYAPVTSVPATNRDITVLPANFKYFRRIVYSHNCVDTSNTVTININNTKPVTSFTPTDTTGCGPLTIHFANTTTPTPATQFAYRWFVDNNVVGTAAEALTHTFNTTVSGFGDTSYLLILVATNGCFTNADTAVVNVLGKPRASFTPDTSSGCSPMVVNFTNNSVGSNVSYTWNFGDGKGNQNFSTHSFAYTYNVHAHTDFKVTLHASNTCGTSRDSTIISVNANTIALHFGISAPLNFGCTGDSVFFKNNTTGANIFRWSFGDNGSPNNTQITTDSFGTVNHVYKNPGAYTVQLCAANSCTKDTCGSIVIYVKQKPKAIFTASPDTVCTGELVTTVNNSQPADSVLAYQWTFGDGSGIYTDKAPGHRYSTSGTDTIWLAVSTLYDQGFACRDSAYQTIVVNGPTGQLTYTDSACAGGQITYQVNSTNTVTYTFDFGDNTPPVTTPTPVTKHIYAHPGLYLPKVTLTTGNCSKLVAGVDSIRVDSIQAAFTVDSIPFCDSTKLLLKDNSFAYFGIQHYAWVINTSKDSGSTASYTITRTTNPLPVSLQVTGTTGCVSQAATPLNVYVHQTPSGKIAINSDACAMQSVSFSASVFSNDPVQYLWTFGNGDRQSGQNVTTIFNPPGIYADTLVAISGFGCADTITSTVTIKATPNLKVTPTGPVNLCLGKTLQLTASGDSIVNWSWNPVDSLSCVTCSNPQAKPAVTTQYVVSGTNSVGCTNSDSVTINVIKPFKITAKPANTSVCLPDTLQAIQFYASGAYRYTWSPATWLSDTTAFNPVVNVPYYALTTSGTYTYQAIGYDQYHCFADTATVTLAIGLPPMIDIGIGNTGVAGRTVILYPKLEENGPFKYFNWSVLSGSGTINTLNKTGDSVQLTINSDVTFKVTAENIYGCITTDTIHYTAFCSQGEQVYIPTAFSPDGDNINDVFMVQGRGITVETFKVFNRWGQVVFDGGSNFSPNLPPFGWNGTVNGQPATEDVYVYIVKLRCTASNISYFLKGNVTLIRVKR